MSGVYFLLSICRIIEPFFAVFHNSWTVRIPPCFEYDDVSPLNKQTDVNEESENTLLKSMSV